MAILAIAVVAVFSARAIGGALAGGKQKQEQGESAATASAAVAEDAATTQASDESTPPVFDAAACAEAKVNETNGIPIMMYHGIFSMTNAEAGNVGGNVDVDGYTRTAEAFTADLEFYYENGYRMIRLEDFINGRIDCEFGKSPIVLTFDDGVVQALVDRWDEQGNPIFKEGCALDVLEKAKAKHPDFNVTATFFVTSSLFDNGDTATDEKLMRWMVDNGYDIGNHTLNHQILTDCDGETIQYQVGGMYERLEEIIPGKYVNIVALPTGVPTDMYADAKYQYIMGGVQDGFAYSTDATLLCAWTYSEPPFMESFDPYYIKRIRAYDANGQNWDIEYNFNELNAGARYISDGNPETITVPAGSADLVANEFGCTVCTY